MPKCIHDGCTQEKYIREVRHTGEPARIKRLPNGKYVRIGGKLVLTKSTLQSIFVRSKFCYYHDKVDRKLIKRVIP
uniref:Uncharacterized protein n=1 Tax=viral metagenome TaxID=1070528 RepID=A0A6M3KDE6_9ZZZZ